jgi:dTDP-4-amino-4,6-dideoxygalactose transaminase
LGDFPVTEKQAEMILTLPVNQSLGQSEIERICVTVNEFYS